MDGPNGWGFTTLAMGLTVCWEALAVELVALELQLVICIRLDTWLK